MLIQSAGMPFPGEVFLVAAAAWAASRHLPIALVMIVGYLAATAGSDLGYILGRRGGRPFVERFGSAFHIRPGQLALAELVFARHGDKALLRSEEHTSELQSHSDLVCRLLLEK